MREWKEQTLLTRKDVRGLIYHMQNHMGGLDELPVGSALEGMSLAEKGSLLEEAEDGAED